MMLKLLHVMLKNDLCKKIIARDAEIIAHDAKNSFIFFYKCIKSYCIILSKLINLLFDNIIIYVF